MWVAGVCAGFERQNLVPAFPIAPPLRQIADAGEGYVALFPLCLLGRLGFYLTDTFLANTKFASKLTQCLSPATANENGLLPFCEFAQIWGDCWRSLIDRFVIPSAGTFRDSERPKAMASAVGLKNRVSSPLIQSFA